LRVALACSWLNQHGGAERVLEVLHEIWPEAPVYTSAYLPDLMPPAYRGWDIRTSFMQRLPGLRTQFQKYLPLFPLAFEQFDFSGYDLVIDNSSAFSYGVVTGPDTLHVSYCLTPARFLWNYHDYVRREGLGAGAQVALAPFLTGLRLWDRAAADRVDEFVAISSLIQARIRKFYRRDSVVIAPPVDCSRFALGAADAAGASHGQGDRDYYLIVSRLIPYKRIDIAIEACKRVGVRLKIAGRGRDRERLESIAAGSPLIEFLGFVADEQMPALWTGCRAFILPGEEDFGLTPLEANAAGRPAIAYAAGGPLDTVVEGQTGRFFGQPTVDALAEVLSSFDPTQFEPAALRAHAESYDVPVFKRRLLRFVEEKLGSSYARSPSGVG
jgi:glycosyltransferase involved in cell wall biosynthesis